MSPLLLKENCKPFHKRHQSVVKEPPLMLCIKSLSLTISEAKFPAADNMETRIKYIMPDLLKNSKLNLNVINHSQLCIK